MAKAIDILKDAVAKAVRNGYKDPGVEMSIGFYLDGTNYYSIIFDKEFAKAIWGSDLRSTASVCPDSILWQWHLRQMILMAEPLKYLEKNLNQDNWKKVLEV